MSVFTPVTPEMLAPFLAVRDVGTLQTLQGISAGVTNTNYFVTTTQGRYVLTLFETLRAGDLPFYVDLMSHLARKGVAVARPIPDALGACVGELAGKPALLAARVRGSVVDSPEPEQCRAVGAMLARLHLAAADFPAQMANPRGPAWWSAVGPGLVSKLSAPAATLLQDELAWQAQHDFPCLLAGVIHADLFRDNVLLDGDQVGGFIDFYYACNDVLLYDLAIAFNDWCSTPDGDIDPARARAMLAGYRAVRELMPQERDSWPALLRAAALRFWVSRLQDFHQPVPGELVLVKDPDGFRRILEHHAQRKDFWL